MDRAAAVLGSYVLLALQTGGYNLLLARMVPADAVAAGVALVAALALRWHRS